MIIVFLSSLNTYIWWFSGFYDIGVKKSVLFKNVCHTEYFINDILDGKYVFKFVSKFNGVFGGYLVNGSKRALPYGEANRKGFCPAAYFSFIIHLRMIFTF